MSKVCIGQIVNVHGIKGAVKIRPYLSDPADIGRFGPLSDKDGHQIFEVTVQSRKGDFVLASIKGITDRTTAEQIKGLNLYINRDQLPPQKDGFYYCDLVGMKVLENGKPFGTVLSVQNYGAGDVLDIKTVKGRVFTFDFSKATFPRVDVSAHEMDIVVPDGMEVTHED
ncbi:MAG: 16S rRNA processing protein RimM [Alphaproteobacteria bacterium]|nr:16S rRNA processing protein RimM [Alphaproteobacteria bacterium]